MQHILGHIVKCKTKENYLNGVVNTTPNALLTPLFKIVVVVVGIFFFFNCIPTIHINNLVRETEREKRKQNRERECLKHTIRQAGSQATTIYLYVSLLLLL